MDISAVPGCYGVFLPGDCPPLRWAVRGGLASTSPSWPLAELATQLRIRPTVPPCPRLSPPRPCRHPEFSSSLTSSLGSGLTTFSRHSAFSRQQAVLGITGFPCSRPCGHLLGKLLGEQSRSSYLHMVCCCWPCIAYTFMLRSGTTSPVQQLVPTPILLSRPVVSMLDN